MQVPPSPKSKPLTGHLKWFKNDPINFMLNSAKEQGDVVLFKVLKKKIYFFNHPDYVKHILQTNYKNYHKSPGYKPLRLLGGMGIFTNDGEEWLHRRKLYQPAFSPSSIQHASASVIENCNAMINSWENAHHKGEKINVSNEMTRVTMSIIGDTLFSTKIPYESDLWNAATYALEWIGERALRSPFVAPAHWPTKKNKKFWSSVKELDHLIYNIIEDKKKNNSNPEDLLSRFMNPGDDKIRALNAKELRDEVMTIFIAGHDTSANVLSWTIYSLTQYPDIQEKLFAEVNALGNRELQFEDLHQLVYTSQVLNETMRLYPPVWHLGRMNLTKDEIGTYPIEQGSHVRMSPLTLHRHPAFWPNPDHFDPERFSPANIKKQVPFSFIPFGAGPRLCAGRNFAMMEMVIILAKMIQIYQFTYEGKAAEMAPMMTLRSKEDIWVHLTKRKN